MATDYTAERGDPTVPACRKSLISLKFTGKLLTMTSGTTVYSYHAESGFPGKYLPIRQGRYWIEPDQPA
jgi:hypothetical protein